LSDNPVGQAGTAIHIHAVKLTGKGGGECVIGGCVDQRTGDFRDKVRCIVGAVDGHGHRGIGGRAIDGRERVAVRDGLACAQGLDGRSGVVQVVKPGATGVDREGAVAIRACRVADGIERSLTRIRVGDGQLTGGGKLGLFRHASDVNATHDGGIGHGRDGGGQVNAASADLRRASAIGTADVQGEAGDGVRGVAGFDQSSGQGTWRTAEVGRGHKANQRVSFQEQRGTCGDRVDRRPDRTVKPLPFAL
jgi:hypothetical protein